MARRLKVLFLPPREHGREHMQRDIVAAIGDRHDLSILDRDAPLAPQFAGVDVVVDEGGSQGTREMADVATSAKLWQILGSGFDKFDLEYWERKGIPIANCPGQFSAVALAECALMFMLMLSRNWNEAQANLREGIFYKPVGKELENRQLTLMGFGASGRELARLAKTFGMDVSAIDTRDISAEERQRFGIEFAGKPADIDRLLGKTDFLSLHLHLNSETKYIINRRRLGMMKSSAFLINVARGALVDEEALYMALVEKRLAGAGLDVFGHEPMDPEHPLLKLPNVIATPHISGGTDGTSRRRAACAAENVDRVANGLEPLYRIDKVSANHSATQSKTESQ
jgi:phosphoglycerate dehydrogenase-like enzyme